MGLSSLYSLDSDLERLEKRQFWDLMAGKSFTFPVINYLLSLASHFAKRMKQLVEVDSDFCAELF